ncbi:MAG: DNA repair protein RecN [Pseudomonadota bacterium]
MLRVLEIRDVLIIDRLELAFQPGLNVLTGETGAGKSILLDALGFVLGWRGRADLVRGGATQGEVIAEFDLPQGHAARAVLKEAGLPVDDALIFRRINTGDGRKTAWVNDRRVSGEILRALSDTLVERHGQHDDRGLLNPRGHRMLLDAFGRLDDLRAKCRTAWQDWREAEAALTDAMQALAQTKSEEDFLRHAATELEALAPQPGEEADLDARRRLMQQAERIREDVIQARVAVADTADTAASEAVRWLERAAEHADGRLDPAIAALGRALVELGEAESGISSCLEALDFDPLELEQAEERLFAIRALSRKHGLAPDDLAAFAETIARRLVSLERGQQDLAALQSAVDRARASYDAEADALSRARKTAAKHLDRNVVAELAPLKMERAEFTTSIGAGEAGPDGRDDVQFQVAPNPGAPAGPLAKIASGGELSRFLLALKVCLTGDQNGVTMIFDEIDRGVGGATADAVGKRLVQLASGGQVLVVTHSPQVAARGAHHWRVEKRIRDQETFSHVRALAGEDRRDEIARMLSGERITDEARAAAQALISNQSSS